MSEQNGEKFSSSSPSSTSLDKDDSKDSSHNDSDQSSVCSNESKTISRLASFKRPRDLTLSASSTAVPIRHSIGVARTKKTFTPNIPIRREKNKVTESGSEKAGKSVKRDKKDGGRGRGRGRKEREFVQTTGSLFGEGIAASGRRPVSGGFSAGGGGGTGGGGGSGDAGFIHKPVLNLNIANNIDKDHEDKMHKELLRDDFISDGSGLNGDDSDDEFFPVQLPMVDTGRGFKEEDEEDKKDAKAPLRQSLNGQDGNIVIKKEPGVEENDASNESTFKSLASDTKNLKLGDSKAFRGGIPGSGMDHIAEQSVSQLLQSKNQEIMFIQLPNCLPSHPPTVKQEENTSKGHQQSQKPSTSSQSTQQQDNEKKTEREFCTLRTLPEGQIGTLKIYKSGRTEMWLGEHKLNVSKGTQVGFLQDVVRIEVNEEEKTGEMSVLGHINHRIICTPDFEALVKHKFT